MWWTIPQHHSDTLFYNLTRECYPMVSLLSSKIGGREGFAPIPSCGELPCEGKLHRRYSHGVGFQISLRFCVLRNEGFYGGRSGNPATNLIIRSKPTAGGCPQTQLGTRYGWPLSHKELLRHLTGFVFKSCWVSISKHPPHQKTRWGRRFSRRQADHGIR